MRLEKLNLRDVARRLDRPFAMIDMALVGDMTVSLYLCQGVLAWHRHLDQDELFWVHQGVILLETERGEVRLRPGEMSIVHKGLAHRSSSAFPSTVILIRCTVFPERKNGRRFLYGTREGPPQRISLTTIAGNLLVPFQPQTVAHIEDAVLQVMRGAGEWPLIEPHAHDALLLSLAGTAIIYEVGASRTAPMTLGPEELTVLYKDTPYQIFTKGEGILVRLTRET
ncbi:MAG: hypothetical protein RML46_03370 [Anaerolineae bacterium]|nr:hypothetical protein [Anaerolineae bacterium]MDW8067932.1 hypothetical protein [Anaerolineae bacterium]